MSFWNPFAEDSDQKVGDDIMLAFFDEAVNYPGFQYSDYTTWITATTGYDPTFVSGLGQLVKSNYASTSVSGAIDRVRELAATSQGMAKPQQIIMTAGTSGGVNWAAAIPEVGYETVKDVATQATEIAQDIGQGTLSTLKLVKYLPIILLGAGAIYLVVMARTTGGSLGRSVEKLSDAAASRIRENPRRRRRK
jgi:hypothetical protein